MAVITLDPGYVIPDEIRDRDDDYANCVLLAIPTQPLRTRFLKTKQIH
ncbi:MAG: hypothetical protein GY697_18755 [Desulfobacterales bacterium]|nr:hypothetical protein [Desulfobacterales bacterium]